MKTSQLAALLACAALASAAKAQMPNSPAPAVPGMIGETQTVDPTSSLQPAQMVYAPRLPAPQELSDVAKARGFTIQRIKQTATQVTVAYQLPDGSTSVVGYVLLSSAAPPSSVVVSTPPTVVYRSAPRVVYYDPWFYDPWYYYPPVSVGIGFGYYGHYGHGGWQHGGFHGGHRGGWRR